MVGKTFDTFAPTGPHLVTADEVSEPHNLAIRLRLNGQTMQDSNTKQMIFSVDQVLAYLSQVFTLQAGDLIFTGTPPRVGKLPRKTVTTTSTEQSHPSRSGRVGPLLALAGRADEEAAPLDRAGAELPLDDVEAGISAP